VTPFQRLILVLPFVLALAIAVAGPALADADLPEGPQTPALPTETPLTRIAFGSCADQGKPQPIWKAVAATDPQLFIFMGDNVYGDAEPPEMTGLEEAYATLATHPDYVPFATETPMLAIWDDHDYGRNDGGAAFEGKEKAKDLFLSFFNVADDDPRRTRGGLFVSESFGPEGERVRVILLDTRYFRSPFKPTDEPMAPGKERYVPDADASRTMLGAEQWGWLNKELAEPADLILVISSIQVLGDGTGFEAWRHLPAERDRLYRMIAEEASAPVVLLSGDRHIAGLYKVDLPTGAPLFEATSSSLNKPFTAYTGEAGPNRLGDAYSAENFGLLEIDWNKQRADLQIRDIDGNVVRETSLSLRHAKSE